MGDVWIRQRNQPVWTKKSSTKLLRRVTHGFDSTISPCGLRNHQKYASTGDAWIRQRNQLLWSQNINENWVVVASEIINENASTSDLWIRQRKQPLWPKKSSSKLLPRVTHGFDSAISPVASEHQRKLSRLAPALLEIETPTRWILILEREV